MFPFLHVFEDIGVGVGTRVGSILWAGRLEGLNFKFCPLALLFLHILWGTHQGRLPRYVCEPIESLYFSWLVTIYGYLGP